MLRVIDGDRTTVYPLERKERMENNRQYIIDGLLVIPAEDMKLCEVESIKDLETVTVYATAKRNFYKITAAGDLDVRRITEEEARETVRDHPEGVSVEVYTKVFGTPERG